MLSAGSPLDRVRTAARRLFSPSQAPPPTDVLPTAQDGLEEDFLPPADAVIDPEVAALRQELGEIRAAHAASQLALAELMAAHESRAMPAGAAPPIPTVLDPALRSNLRSATSAPLPDGPPAAALAALNATTPPDGPPAAALNDANPALPLLEVEGRSAAPAQDPIELERPSRILLYKQQLKLHDPTLFSDTGKRLTTTVPSLYAWIRQNSPNTVAQLEEDVHCPGVSANGIIQEFLAAVQAWLRPEIHTLCGLLIEGLTRSPESSSAGRTEDLLCIAVDAIAQGKMAEITAEVTRTGMYDRTKCDHDDFLNLPGLALFDPTTGVGKKAWAETMRLIVTYFKRPECWKTELEEAELAVEMYEQQGDSIQDFLSTMTRLFGKVKKAGGLWSDQQKVKAVLKNCSTDLQNAFADYVRMTKARSEYKPAVEREYGAFSSVLEAVGMSLTPSCVPCAVPTEIATAVRQPRIPSAMIPSAMKKVSFDVPSGDGEGELPEGHCWNWAAFGQCKYGDACKMHHGTPKVLWDKVADEYGNCKLEMEKGSCKRKFCPLKHQEERVPGVFSVRRMGAKLDSATLKDTVVMPRPRPAKIAMLAQESEWKRDVIRGGPKKIFCFRVARVC